MKTKTESKNEILWPAIMGFDRFLIVVLVITLLASGIQAVSAETLTGTISDTTLNSTNYHQAATHTSTGLYEVIKIKDIEKLQGLNTLVRWSETQPDTFDVGAPVGYQQVVTFRITNSTMSLNHAVNRTGTIMGTGSIGYQRFFDINGNELSGGYTYASFNSDWNLLNLTGTQYVFIDANGHLLYNATFQKASGDVYPSGLASWYGDNGLSPEGWHTLNKNAGLYAVYSCDKPSGLGITGTINKTSSVGGTQYYNSKVYIVDALYRTISNEPFLSPNSFYFNTNASQIRISLLGSSGQWANSSLLFSSDITPTPTGTPTPTVTPPPTGTFDIQFYVKDNGNSTPLQNTYVELHRNDVFDSVLAGYTDVNGLITFAGVPRPNYSAGHNQMESRYWKTGYQYSTWSFNPTQIGNYFHTQYLVPDIGENPLVPATVNITVHSIDGSNGNANLASAYVEVYPNAPGPGGVIDWTYKLTGFTNASGLITFQNVPASAYNEIKTTKSGYSTDDYWIGVTPLSDFQHNAYLTTFGVTPTPTPLPQTGNYTLVISPVTVPYNGNTTGTISSVNDPTLAGIQQIWYAYGDPMSDPVNAFDFFESGSYSKALQYIKNSSGTWMGWDYATNTFSNNKGATIPNPNNLIFNGPGGTKTVYCTITLTNGIQYDLLGTVVVGAGAGQINTKIQAVGGYGAGFIYSPEIDILNKNTGIWKNGTYASGLAEITAPTGTRFDVYGFKTGYANAELLNILAQDQYTYPLQFNAETTPSIGNQTFNVWVYNTQSLAIPGATVTITKVGGTSLTGSTAGGGLAQFTLLNLTSYNYFVSKTGYQSASGSFTTTGATTGELVIKLTVGAVPTATIPPTATPTIIPTGTGGNYSGFWGPIAEGAKGAGAATNEIPLLLAALLIFIGFCVGGWSGAAYSPNSAFNGQASLGGGVFGFVLSCMFGFIPIVWVISIIIIGIFVFIFFTRS